MAASIGSAVPSKNGPATSTTAPPVSICNVPPSDEASPAMHAGLARQRFSIPDVLSWAQRFGRQSLFPDPRRVVTIRATQDAS